MKHPLEEFRASRISVSPLKCNVSPQKNVRSHIGMDKWHHVTTQMRIQEFLRQVLGHQNISKSSQTQLYNPWEAISPLRCSNGTMWPYTSPPDYFSVQLDPLRPPLGNCRSSLSQFHDIMWPPNGVSDSSLKASRTIMFSLRTSRNTETPPGEHYEPPRGRVMALWNNLQGHQNLSKCSWKFWEKL